MRPTPRSLSVARGHRLPTLVGALLLAVASALYLRFAAPGAALAASLGAALTLASRVTFRRDVERGTACVCWTVLGACLLPHWRVPLAGLQEVELGRDHRPGGEDSALGPTVVYRLSLLGRERLRLWDRTGRAPARRDALRVARILALMGQDGHRRLLLDDALRPLRDLSLGTATTLTPEARFVKGLIERAAYHHHTALGR